MSDSAIQNRKKSHLRICLEDDVQSSLSTGFEHYRLPHTSLPELDLHQVDVTTTFLGKNLQVPFLFSGMTGGMESGSVLNQRLAVVAQELGMAMCVGSQRAAIENEQRAVSFHVREYAPDILLFANMGAVQLNYGVGVDGFRKAVEMIEADGLVLHFNALQEAIQPEGDVNFAGLLDKIENLCGKMDVPVIAKEVGWGFSKADVNRLLDAGISVFDAAGAGGTSWSQVEKFRAEGSVYFEAADAFRDWGISTADVLLNVREVNAEVPLIASGGMKTGVDVVKSLVLGANLGGFARTILPAAMESEEALLAKMKVLEYQLKVAMFMSGAGSISALKNLELKKVA
jgi:isopentenyl-diphosphate delta-isomerase